MTNHNERSFLTALKTLNTQEHTATFYIMNTSKNRNDWGVSDKALFEALPTLKNVPIGMGKNYKLGHFEPEESMDSGKFTSYEKPGSYAFGTAKIDDKQTWDMMKTGKLGSVSVVIQYFQEYCSLCGANLAEYQDNWHDHECIKKGQGYGQIESFKFERVDFVDVPAYPQAGILEMSAQTKETIPLTLYAEFYECQNKPNKLKVSNLTDNPEKTVSLEAELKKTVDQAKKDAEANTKTINELKAELEAIKKASHDKLVNETFEARKQAGITGKVEDEMKFLLAQTNETLEFLKADAAKIASIIQAFDTSPKTKYGKVNGDGLDESIKEMRAELGLSQEAK